MKWLFFFSSRRRHTRCSRDWSSDVCSSDLHGAGKGFRSRGRYKPVYQCPIRSDHTVHRHSRLPVGCITTHDEHALAAQKVETSALTRAASAALLNEPQIAHTGCIRRTRYDKPAACRARDRKSTRLNSSHGYISYAVFCLKKTRA